MPDPKGCQISRIAARTVTQFSISQSDIDSYNPIHEITLLQIIEMIDVISLNSDLLKFFQLKNESIPEVPSIGVSLMKFNSKI